MKRNHPKAGDLWVSKEHKNYIVFVLEVVELEHTIGYYPIGKEYPETFYLYQPVFEENFKKIK